jgi:DMSO/TMAO reductase YedYZ molybdopterin-dependent catalytic subunit
MAVSPFRDGFFRSPLRGPWLASILSSALLPLIAICAITGFLSHAAYQPRLPGNAVFGGPGPGNGFDLYGFDWPTSPAWLYAATQGLHVISGVAAIPILLAKLWAVIPKLWEWPPLRSPAHAIERASLALLVGGALFVFSTGVINIQLWYPFRFGFVPAHYYGAILFLGALGFHLVLKLPVMRRAFRERGVMRPLREGLADTKPEDGRPAAAPTLTRRALLGGVGAASAGLGLMATGQVVGGPLADLAVLAPRGRGRGDGPNAFPVNKTFAAVGIPMEAVGPRWRLTVRAGDGPGRSLGRPELMAMRQITASLPIACVEGWSTTQSWTGVRLADLARLAGIDHPDELLVHSLQDHGLLRRVTLNDDQIAHPHAMLALRVNSADLSLDHGFPARIIVPALPGVHCTKWVREMVFT